MFNTIISEIKNSYNILFNEDNYKLSIASLSILIWCWGLRFIFLYNTNEEALKWGANSLGHIIAVLSGLYSLTILLNILDKIKINYNGLKLDTIILMCFDASFLYIMAGIFIHDMSLTNFGYLLVDIFKLSYFTYMMTLCFQRNKIVALQNY